MAPAAGRGGGVEGGRNESGLATVEELWAREFAKLQEEEDSELADEVKVGDVGTRRFLDSKVEVVLNASEKSTPDGTVLSGVVKFNTDLFERASIERLVARLSVVASSLASPA